MIPTRIGHHIKAVFGHADSWVFATSRHIEVFPFIATRKEDWSAMMLEVDTVFAKSITDARGSGTYAFCNVVLSPIEKCYAAINDGCSRVEGFAVFPLRNPLPHRTIEAACRIWTNDWVCPSRSLKAEPSPLLLNVWSLLCLHRKQKQNRCNKCNCASSHNCLAIVNMYPI